MATTTTTFMLMTLPVPLSEPGPSWASEIIDAFGVIDAHDHSTGKGTPVTPAGLNVTSDLSMKGTGTTGNNLTDARSLRLESQASTLAGALDKGAVYRVGNELYYNDANGTAVRITLNGTVDTSGSGSITGMGGTGAAAAYSNVSKTFSFTQASNQAAAIDAGNLLLREEVVAGNAVTLKAPTGLAASYSVTMPAALPAATNTTLLTIDDTGAIAASLAPVLTIRPTFAGINPGNTADTTAGNLRWTGTQLQARKSVGGVDQWVDLVGWDYLASYVASGDVATSGALAIPARDELMIVIRGVTPSTLGGWPGLRFNGDSAANYRSRFLFANGGSTTLSNQDNLSKTSMPVSDTTGNIGGTLVIWISNLASLSKSAVIKGSTRSGSAASSAQMMLAGDGEWVNTAAQITSVELLAGSSTNVLGAGGAIAIFGRSFT